MINETISDPYSNDLECEVCGAPISYPESLTIRDLGYLVCQAFDCRRIMKMKSTMPASLFQSQIQFQRKLQLERHEKEVARKKFIEEFKVRQDRENQRILEIVLNDNPQLSNKNTHVVNIPSGLSTTDIPAQERVNLYKDHLIRIIDQATGQFDSLETEIDERKDVRDILIKVEEIFIENSKLRSICDQLCSICKGGCCTSGKEHAYLSAISIKRYMDLNPDLSADDVLNRYLSYISPETIVGACINQTKIGCALPKELRSDTCNGHYCDSLKSYQQKLADKEDIGTVLAIQRAGTCWNSCGPQTGAEIRNVALVVEAVVQFQDLGIEVLNEDVV